MEDLDPNDIQLVPTEDLVSELSRRYDIMFMVGMKVDPPPDDEPYDYWISGSYATASVLTQYALSHYAIQMVKESITEQQDDV